jgi:hypothetical protein
MQGVCGELERCRTPDDQDVVEGLIKKLLAKLPEDLVEKEHEKTLRANGLCRVRCVQRLTEEKLEALGISMGDAMVLLDVLHAAVMLLRRQLQLQGRRPSGSQMSHRRDRR